MGHSLLRRFHTVQAFQGIAVLRNFLDGLGDRQKGIRNREHNQHERCNQRPGNGAVRKLSCRPVEHREHAKSDNGLADEHTQARPAAQRPVRTGDFGLVRLIGCHELRLPSANHPVAHPEHSIGQLLVEPVALLLHLPLAALRQQQRDQRQHDYQHQHI